MRPRRQQTPITIRSDRAAERLALLTRNGRSQAEVIEDALDRVAGPQANAAEREAFLERLRQIGERGRAGGDIPSMAEFDEATYDERGLLR
jgi:hypothetical protein